MAETRGLRIPTARDLMEEIELTFSPEMDLLQAIDRLVRHRVSAAPVVDENRHLLGMLTEKDCLRILYSSAIERPQGGRVSGYLSPVSEAIGIDMDLFRITEIFLGNNFPMLPVVDGGKLVGCITRQAMLRGIIALTGLESSAQFRMEAEAREAVSRPRSIADLQKVFARYTKDQLVSRIGRKC